MLAAAFSLAATVGGTSGVSFARNIWKRSSSQLPWQPSQLTSTNCSLRKYWRNSSRSLVSSNSLGSQSLTSFFMPCTAMRAPRRANGTKKNTMTRIKIARRAKKVGLCIFGGLRSGRGRQRQEANVIQRSRAADLWREGQATNLADSAIPSTSSKWESQLKTGRGDGIVYVGSPVCGWKDPAKRG